MSDLLFSGHDLADALASMLRDAVQEVETWDEGQLLAGSETEIVNYLTDKYLVACPAIDRDGIEVDEPVDVQQQVRGSVGPIGVPAARVVVHVPFDGEAAFFQARPNSYTGNPPRAGIGDGELRFTYEQTSFDAASLRQRIEADLSEIERWLGWSRAMADDHNNRVRPTVEQAVTTRKQRLLNNRNMAAGLGYKIRRRDEPPGVAIPAKKRTLRTQAPRPTAAASYQPEPALADADYEEAIRVIQASGRQLERVPATAAKLSEEERRDLMLVNLNTTFEGEAGGELFNGAGKTDILIRVDDRNIFIGECKIWRGASAFTDAIDQLRSYLVWRDSKAALILFIPNLDATAVIDKAHEAIAGHACCLRVMDTTEPNSRWDYIFKPDQDDAREIRLAFLPFVVPGPVGD